MTKNYFKKFALGTWSTKALKLAHFGTWCPYRVAQKVSHYQMIKKIELNRMKACQ